MAKAGYCEACGANVWLTAEGGCVNGHPTGSVTGVYDAGPLAATSEEPTASRGPKKRRVLFIVAGALVALLAACALVVVLGAPVLGRGAALADEWQDRLAADYPGWRAAGFNVRTFSGGGETETEYSFTVFPPDRDFPVGVSYVSRGDGPPESQDEVFRPDGAHHDRAESLLDYVDRNYVDSGKAVTAITSGEDGLVTVSWMKHTRVGFFSTRVGSFDELEYDEDSDTWSAVFSPGD